MAKRSYVQNRRLDGKKRELNCAGLKDEEIAPLLGISRARVFQIRQRALAKIRQTILEDPDLADLASELCGFDITR